MGYTHRIASWRGAKASYSPRTHGLRLPNPPQTHIAMEKTLVDLEPIRRHCLGHTKGFHRLRGAFQRGEHSSA